jgi:hypothetical protein
MRSTAWLHSVHLVGFDCPNSLSIPMTDSTAPPTAIHIPISFDEPMKNRERNEPRDSDALPR